VNRQAERACSALTPRSAGRLEPQRPSAAPIVRGWKPHRTPGNWTLRASLAMPPCGGWVEPPPAVSPHRRPQFSTAGRLTPHPSPHGTGARMRGGVFPLSPLPNLGEGRGQGEWGEGPNRAWRFRLSKAAVFNCRPLRGPPPPRPRPPPVGGSRTERPATK